ncbi:protein PFC0760c isoform X1 [Monomorium pharaonis]|uniref:protein PFC0760c isoform X1 n=2 Tax=Monomorium pharaonis TaxID=307658 RepID=UPI001745CF76|nr:protein PFC0760c isoform X1 [Monomorium pharaonis]XP_028044816.2 protein PFC0760c isoform X1 [Monomorium pharaonis]
MEQALCSHKSITWEITDNSVAGRMIDNSLMHKFKQLRRIRRRTKVLNAEIKKDCGMKEYKRYIELKTNVLRNVINDTDTSDSSNLTDVDYDIIYSSPSKRAKYMTKNSERYRFTSEEECESYKRLKGCKKRSSKDRNIKKRKETKLSQVKHTSESEECVNTGWQQIVKHDSNISRNLQKQMHTSTLDNEESILEDNNRLDVRSSEQVFSSQLVSENCMTSAVTKSRKKHTKQEHRDSNAMDNELNCKDNTVSNKTKCVGKRKIRNNKNQSVAINIEFNSHDSKYRPLATEENNESKSELNTLVRSEGNDNKLTVINKNLIKNHNDTCVSHRPELLKNVKRNLISVLETADVANSDKDVETDKNVDKDELNYDQLYSAIAIVDQHSTLLNKIQTKKKDLSPDASSLDQQKDSGIDEDTQDKFVKGKKCNNNIPMTQNIKKNIEKIHISSQRLKKIDEVVETMKNCKENVKDVHLIFNDDILEKQISEEKHKHFTKAKDSSDQQLLSPEKDDIKDAYSESCDHIQEKEDNREARKLAREKISLKLSKVDKDAGVSSVNHKEKRDSEEERESSGITINSHQLNQSGDVIEIYATNHEDQNHSLQSENLCDIQKQTLLSSKENHMKDVRFNEEKEEKHFFQLKQTDNNTNMQLTNQEDKTCIELEITHDTQKQHLLPKVTCTEILDRRYKIIDKKDVENNIENIDNINNNMDAVNECIPKKNELIHCPDVISEQKIVINEEEEIDTPLLNEKDNEEDNINYMSPQTRKRLEQQAKLNLVVDSDSSESDDDYVITKRSRHVNNSHTNCYSEDKLNDETNGTSKQTKINISDGENICEDIFVHKEATSKVVELESTNIKEKIKKKAESITRCTNENNDSFQFTTNKDPLEETQYYENVYNDDDQNQNGNFQPRVSENNVTCNDEDSINQLQRQKQSSLSDKENMYSKNNQNEQIINTELGTRHASEYEQSTQTSTKCLSAQLNISSQYRPCNLQQLVEDQQLLVETIPASFTLTDISEDEEAFLLNIPSKVVQCNLQDQILTIKTKSIKFNEIKYKIVCKEVSTTSCIFATGKTRKPYKIVNIKNISTITVREKLQDSRKSDVSNSSITVSPVSKSLKKNRRIDKIHANVQKISKRKKCKLKDSKTGCL